MTQTERFSPYAIGALVLLALMTFARCAHAAVVVSGPPVIIETHPGLPLEAWIALGIAALGSIRGIVRGIADLAGMIAKRTSNTVDDGIHEKLDLVADTLDEIATLIPPRKSPGPVLPVAAVLLSLGVLGMATLQSSCATVRAAPGAAHVAVVECAKKDAAPILALAVELATQAALAVIGAGHIDWDALEHAAYEQGETTGGCAFKRFVAELSKAPAPQARGLVALPDPTAEGQAALARLSTRFGGVTWQ
jgi:hypothetical protein